MDILKKKKIGFVIAIAFIILFAGAVMVMNRHIDRKNLRPEGGTKFAKAVVKEVLSSQTEEMQEGEVQGNQEVKVKILSGKYKGRECKARSPYANRSGAKTYKGCKVIVLVNEDEDGEMVASVYNYDRGGVLLGLVMLFLFSLCLIGGKKGVASAVGLVFTFICIFGFYVPLMYIGVPPFLAAVVTALLITVVVMFFIGGFTRKTLCAVLGTLAGIMVAGGIAVLFGKLGKISGLNAENIETLAYVAQNSRLKVGGILFSGILITSLGAVMDVSMSVSSTIAEIHDANPEFGMKRLLQSGINVGRDMMGTMSNTLILAFAGNSVSLLLIIYSYNMSYLEYMNRYDIGIEILQGISGSLGVIFTVPFVSIIASFIMTYVDR